MPVILVTGSNGQLGQSILKFSEQLTDVQFLFHDVDTLDLTRYDEVTKFFKENRPGVVVNCAAYTAVDKAESDRENAFRINAEVPAFLAKTCAQYQSKLIHISTDYVFNGQTWIPYRETDTPNPQSVYGESKLAGEQKVLQYAQSTIIRTAWLYSSLGSNFMKTILRIGKENDEIRVVADQTGSPTSASDLAKAVLAIIQQTLDNESSYHPGIFHFTNEGICSWYDFASEIIRITRLNCHVIPIETKDYPLPARRPFYSVLNKTKIKELYHLNIPNWRDSLQEVLSEHNTL